MAYLLLALRGLSFVQLAAHFYRAGLPALAVASLALIALLAVAAFTAASALVFRNARLRVRYNIGGRP